MSSSRTSKRNARTHLARKKYGAADAPDLDLDGGSEADKDRELNYASAQQQAPQNNLRESFSQTGEALRVDDGQDEETIAM